MVLHIKEEVDDVDLRFEGLAGILSLGLLRPLRGTEDPGGSLSCTVDWATSQKAEKSARSEHEATKTGRRTPSSFSDNSLYCNAGREHLTEKKGRR